MAIADSMKLPTLGEKTLSAWDRTFRVTLALVGGYLLTAGYISFTSAGLPKLGMNAGEAAFFGLLTGLLIFVGFAVWVAATKFIARMAIASVLAIVLLNYTASFIVATGV